jgi:hypothetical protein
MLSTYREKHQLAGFSLYEKAAIRAENEGMNTPIYPYLLQ